MGRIGSAAPFPAKGTSISSDSGWEGRSLLAPTGSVAGRQLVLHAHMLDEVW